MRYPKIKTVNLRLLCVVVFGLAALLTVAAHAAVPGIQGPSFNLVAAAGFISQPDGASVYSWGYGCSSDSNPSSQSSSTPKFVPKAIANANCQTMQIPGPTLIVNQGDTITVTLTNKLPAAAGSTSILFPGFQVSSSGTGAPGLLTAEAAQGGSVTYTFTATTAGTHAYYSGTQSDLQIEMGLYGVIVVLPTRTAASVNCDIGIAAQNLKAEVFRGESDFRLASAAYDHPSACYDREYLFQFSEIDPRIHEQAEQQAAANTQCVQASGCMTVETEPYHPGYFMINGRSMPDDMDPNYAVQYPHQPYNGNPHMHPGELVLLRVVGTGRWQHPFHEHGNHVRILARDGNLITSASDATKLAGPLLFTTTTTPGLAMDGIFYWTGKGLNWDVYAHGKAPDGSVHDPGCVPDANGYYTAGNAFQADNYYEWCQDHGKALEKNPLGQVPTGGPVTLPDANILTNGFWYGGSPYLGPEATVRAVGTRPIPPSGTVANDPGTEAGFAFMWHSHNEREITTNNAFPGGMMMMMLVDPRAYVIDEAK